ncbi:MAG: HAD family phosphatase [Candidatus Gastranaerophilales bacterium]|nr:HAD family phosphatase [Candidatus Gastranaerophilales bacterium]
MNNDLTIFFDWSGVVADDTGDEFIKSLLRNVGADDNLALTIFENEFTQFMKGHILENDFWNILRKKYNLDVKEPYAGKFNHWVGLKANNDIVRYVDSLKSKGVKVAVLTNIIKPVYEIIKKTGGYNVFDSVIASCEVGLVKPQKEIYDFALNCLETTAKKSIFVDDKIQNIEAAAKMGFKTILAKNSHQIIQDLDKIIGG